MLYETKTSRKGTILPIPKSVKKLIAPPSQESERKTEINDTKQKTPNAKPKRRRKNIKTSKRSRLNKLGKNEAENSNSNKKLSNAFPHEILDLYAVIPESDKTLSYVKLQFAPKTFRRALVDTGACANVISQTNFNDLKTDKFLYQEIVTQKSKLKRVRMAGGQLVPIEIEATICFKIAAKTFTEIFLVLPTANSMILGNCFYKKHDVQICPKYDLFLEISRCNNSNK